MMSTATMSSMMASASRKMRSGAGMDLPSSARTPTANAMSVAVGMAQPLRSAGSCPAIAK
ncbi:hypothetical protein D3C72_2390950 [compost metagenome]